MKSKRSWVQPAVYAISIPAGIAGALTTGAAGLALPLVIGVAGGGAVGWWVNRIIKIRRSHR